MARRGLRVVKKDRKVRMVMRRIMMRRMVLMKDGIRRKGIEVMSCLNAGSVETAAEMEVLLGVRRKGEVTVFEGGRRVCKQ